MSKPEVVMSGSRVNQGETDVYCSSCRREVGVGERYVVGRAVREGEPAMPVVLCLKCGDGRRKG